MNIEGKVLDEMHYLTDKANSLSKSSYTTEQKLMALYRIRDRMKEIESEHRQLIQEVCKWAPMFIQKLDERIKDYEFELSLVTTIPQGNTSPIKEFETPRAKHIFKVYQDNGYFEILDNGEYQWLKTDLDCAIFAAIMSELFPKKKNPHDRRKYHWKEFEDLFGKKQLSRTFYDKCTKEDIESSEIYSIFCRNFKQ